jgi:hypothetical protein
MEGNVLRLDANGLSRIPHRAAGLALALTLWRAPAFAESAQPDCEVETTTCATEELGPGGEPLWILFDTDPVFDPCKRQLLPTNLAERYGIPSIAPRYQVPGLPLVVVAAFEPPHAPPGVLVARNHVIRVNALLGGKQRALRQKRGRSSGCVVPWNVDGLDGTLDGQLRCSSVTRAVRAYVLDGGVEDTSATTGRVEPPVRFCRETASWPPAHGTQISNVMAGTCIGVAPTVRIQPVNVMLPLEGEDETGTLLSMLRGIGWVRCRECNGSTPSLALMALSVQHEPVIDAAVALLARAGVPLVAGADDNPTPVENVSPGGAPAALTASALQLIGGQYQVWAEGGHGCRILAYAPGVDIDVGGGLLRRGTSLAAAHLAGVVALDLGRNGRQAVSDIRDAILEASFQDIQADTCPHPECCRRLIVPSCP